MKKRIILCLIAVAVVFASVSITVYAENPPTLTAQTSLSSVTQGNNFTLSIKASNFETVSAVDFNVYYDSAAMSVKSTSNGGMITQNSISSVNTDNSGVINVSLVNPDGFSTSGTLLNIVFNVNSECVAGSYDLRMSVGDCYGLDFAGVTARGTGASISVTEVSATQKTFSVYSYLSKTSASCGDVVSVRLANSNGYYFGSGDFVLNYDSEIFEVESVELESGLKKETATYSINKDIKGTVLVSYANSTAVNSFYMIKINLKVIADINGSTKLSYESRNIYTEDLTQYLPYSSTSSVTLKKLPETVDNSNIWLESSDVFYRGKTATSVLKLEKGAGVAAGDFKINYDPEVLRCVSVSVGKDIASIGGTLIVDDGFGDGSIEFPYVNENGYSETDIELICIEWEILKGSNESYIVSIEGTNVYDVNYKKVELEYITLTGVIEEPPVEPEDIDGDGVITVFEANIAHKIASGEALEVTESILKAIDIDESGDITFNDSSLIIEYVLEN